MITHTQKLHKKSNKLPRFLKVAFIFIAIVGMLYSLAMILNFMSKVEEGKVRSAKSNQSLSEELQVTASSIDHALINISSSHQKVVSFAEQYQKGAYDPQYAYEYAQSYENILLNMRTKYASLQIDPEFSNKTKNELTLAKKDLMNLISQEDIAIKGLLSHIETKKPKQLATYNEAIQYADHLINSSASHLVKAGYRGE